MGTPSLKSIARPRSYPASDASAWRIEVFFDGECPLCIKEIKMLQRLDRKNRIKFTNIASSEFDPSSIGKTMDNLMEEIHGRLADGRWICGVEVFRQLYAAVGLGPVVGLTRLPLISHGLELGYRVFAKNRLRLTGRCDAKSGACSL